MASMADLCGIYTAMSTAHVPICNADFNGRITAMTYDPKTARSLGILARVNERLDALGLSMSAASQKATGSRDTIRNWTRGNHLPRYDTIEKLAAVLEVTPEWLWSGEEGASSFEFPRLSSLSSVTQERSLDLLPVELPNNSLTVTGKVAANTWLDVDDIVLSSDEMETVPAAGSYPVAWQFALLVNGNCLNKIANHNDILVCVSLAKSGESFKDGDLVIVERQRYAGHMIQRTAKRVKRTAHGFELWPESTDPAHQDPIRLDSSYSNESISVIGRVLLIIRKP